MPGWSPLLAGPQKHGDVVVSADSFLFHSHMRPKSSQEDVSLLLNIQIFLFQKYLVNVSILSLHLDYLHSPIRP